MNITDINARGMVLLGCGKMGSALLAGWLKNGVKASSVWVQDPFPSDWVNETGVHVNEALPEHPAVLLIAVKPQMMDEALPSAERFGTGRTLILSVAAGTSIARYEQSFGSDAPIIRTMPNTPAAVGQGVTALIGNNQVDQDQMDLAEALMSAVGQTVRLQSEAQMDAVTGVSGSGPAYVFHMIECLARAGEAEGLPAEMAMTLAKATVAGAGALAVQAEETPSQLRVNVTSPNGTTQAGLEQLMDDDSGLPSLMARTVKAATDRSKELG